jgi:hypothetical protein
MGELFGKLSLIGYVGMTVFFYGAMAGILLMLRRLLKDTAELRKAVQGLEEQILTITPPAQAKGAAKGD